MRPHKTFALLFQDCVVFWLKQLVEEKCWSSGLTIRPCANMSNLLCQANFSGQLIPEFCTNIQVLAITPYPQSDINFTLSKNPLTSQSKNSIKLLTKFLNIS
jgi:hypothetical protein